MEDNKYISKEYLKTYVKTKGFDEERSTQLVKSLVADGYTIEGLNDQKKTGFLDKAGGAIKNVFTERASNIGEGISEIGEAYNEGTKPGGSIGAGLAGASIKALQQPLNVLGQAAGGVWDLATQAVMSIVPEDIKEKGQEFITNFIENSELAQKTLSEISEIQEKYPDVARALGNALNILPAPPAGKLATAGVKGTGKLTTKAIGGLDDLIKSASELTETAGKSLTRKISPTTEIAVENTYKGLLKQIENKKSIMSDFVKREGTGKDPLRVISENPDYMVRIDTASKSFDVKDAVSNLNRDVAQYSKVRDAVLSTADDTFGNIATDDVLKNVFTRISGKNYKTYLDEGERAVKSIITKMKSLKKFNPETISRVELNNVRKGIDDTINTFTNTKLQDKLRLDVRTSFKEILEQSLPDNTLLKELNGKIGDLIDTSDFLTKKLAGSKVKGGGLTDLAIKTAGSQAGAIIGAGAGGVLGGVPGAIAGYGVSNFLSKSLIKNAINNPFDRKVLEKMLQETPDIIKKSQEFINKMKSQTAKSTEQRLLSSGKGTKGMDKTPIVDSPNPNGGVMVDYTPQARMTANIDDALIQEAKKYKSAEEFVNAQGTTVYHGTDSSSFNPKDFNTSKAKKGESFFNPLGKGMYTSTNKDFVKRFGKNTEEFVIPPTAKVKNISIDTWQKDFPLISRKSLNNLGIKYDDLTFDEKLEINRLVPNTPIEVANNFEVLLRDISDRLNKKGSVQEAIQKAVMDKYKAYDVLKYLDTDYAFDADEIVIKNPAILKTKSQLIDIWNKAHK